MPEATPSPCKVEGRTAWLLTDGKIGDEIPARGVVEAMGLSPDLRVVRPGPLFAALAPWGPANPWDWTSICHARQSGHPAAYLDSRLRGNDSGPNVSPAIAFAAGRRTVPYLRALKRASPRTFTIFLGHPRTRRHRADAIWAPAHDGLTGPNVIVTDTTPHTRTPRALAQARDYPDVRVAALPAPRAALLLGGPSRRHPFGADDMTAVLTAATAIRAGGHSLAVSASRRTPPALVAALRARFAGDPGAFVWAGEGDNPYPSLLALADAIVVTADSINMLSEALARGAPVHVLPLAGDGGRPGALVAGLLAREAVRLWRGAVEHWKTTPIDSTLAVAAAVASRFAAFQQALAR